MVLKDTGQTDQAGGHWRRDLEARHPIAIRPLQRSVKAAVELTKALQAKYPTGQNQQKHRVKTRQAHCPSRAAVGGLRLNERDHRLLAVGHLAGLARNRPDFGLSKAARLEHKPDRAKPRQSRLSLGCARPEPEHGHKAGRCG